MRNIKAWMDTEGAQHATMTALRGSDERCSDERDTPMPSLTSGSVSQGRWNTARAEKI